MRLQYLLSKFLLAFVDISIELVAVLPDGKLLVVIDRDVDFLGTHWLVLRVMELGNVGVSESLLCSQALMRVELEQRLQKVERVVRSCGKHISEALGLCRR